MAVKILHIIKSLGRGGAEVLLPESLKLHNKELFEFHYIYFLPWKNQMEEAIRNNGGIITCVPAKNNLHLLTKITAVADYVRREKIQLIHAHLPWAGILARIVGKLCSVPVVYTEHNKQERYHPATRAVNLWTMNWLTRVIAVSADVAKSIRQHKNKLKTPVDTIVNGVNVSQFNRSSFLETNIRLELGIPQDALVIGTIAVFRFQKRLDVWMQLAAVISKRFENIHFIIVGDGPLMDVLVKKRKDLGLETNIHLPGLRTEVRPFLATFDIYMMTSIFEGLPVALLEAMAMNCPIVSTDAGGIKEVVRHEIDGLLCPTDTPNQLVEFADKLLRDRELRLRFGERARERIVTMFSMNQMIEQLEATYLKTLKNR